METRLADWIRDTPKGKTVEAVLRSCVHCGFCTATCPTYQLLGDELDGPRGRIYLMKQMFETGEVSASTREHLDRCLTCRSCETTCPSGVEYHKLLDIGRETIETLAPRPLGERLQRRALRAVLPQRKLIPERLTGADGRLVQAGDAVHAVRQQDAVPVDAGWLGQLVRHVQPQAIALDGLDGRTRSLAVVAPAVDY